MRTFLYAAVLLTTAAACSSVGSDSADATDSFAKPTHHGELDFHGDNDARFSDSQRFHGWSFTLTGDAEVTLGTELRTANLDTHLYLYNADEDGKKTGRNIANDDNGGDDGLSSAVTKTLGAGNYFVQVKTKNVAMRGSFNLAASCLGAGCPVDEPTPPADYCDSAHESIGKCMDDGYSELECAPSDSDALLCCNAFPQDEWFCEDLCVTSDLHLARAWNDDYDRLFDVYPEDDYSGLQDVYALAVNQCASPDLDELAAQVANGTDLVQDDTFDPEPWIARGDADFFRWDITEEIVSVIDQIVGEQAASRFEASVEVPCPNCTDGYTVHGFYYPQVGKVVVLEARWGGDS